MEKSIKVVLFAGVLLMVPSSLLAATPTISSVSGTVATGQTLTISGANMVQENKTNWSSFNKSHTSADGFEGSSPSVDGYSAIGPSGGTYDTSTKILGSKSIRFHVNGPNTQNVGDYNGYTIGTATSDMWFRYYVRYRASNNIWFNNYAKQLYLMGTGGNYYLDVDGAASGMPTRMKTTVGSGVNSYGNIPGGTLKNDRWYLVEVHVVNQQIMDVFVDTVKILTTPKSNLTDSVTQKYLLFGIPNAKESSAGLSVDNWWDGLVSATSRIYAASTIEISNNPTYGAGTIKYQEPIYLSDGTVQFKADLSGLGSGPYYLWVTNNQQQRSSYNLTSGTGGGTTPPPATDTTPPSVPSLTATAVSSSQINLSWTASTDNTGVTGYKIYRNGTYLTTTTSTSYNNTGLTAATAYSYRVSAIDAAGNESSQSTAKSVTTQASSSGGGGNAFMSTTFNYGPCTQRGALGQTDCGTVRNDGINWNWGGNPVDNNYTQTTSAANYPGGGGGYGMRSWKGDGSNVLSGPVRFDFPSTQREFWVRWYERWENGSRWSDGIPGYTKSIYMRTEGPSGPYAGFYASGYRIANQGSTGAYPRSDSGGWTTVYPSGVSDGSWHSYEIHMKMDTNGTDGIGQIWVDGNLVSSMTNVNWSGGNSLTQRGFTYFDFQNNQASLANGKAIYVDTDDMVIYTSTPPKRDAQGNPYIGLIGSTGGGTTPTDTTPPSVPSLTATAVSSSQINLSWTASTDNTGVTGYKIYRNGTYLTTTTSTSYNNTGLTAATAYSYRVSAIDAAGNESSQSTAKSATTLAGTGGTDTTPPAVPTGLSVK